MLSFYHIPVLVSTVDFAKIFFGATTSHEKVVVKTVFDVGSEGELDVGIEPHDGTSHNVSGGVAESVEGSVHNNLIV